MRNRGAGTFRSAETRSTARRGSRARRWPAVRVLVAVLGVALAAPASLVAQAPGPVSVDSADAIRASLERPPRMPPADIWDGLSLPLKFITSPLHLAGQVMKEMVRIAVVPGRPPNPVLGAIRSLDRWGLSTSFGSVGPRSGPGLQLRLERFDPFFAEATGSFRTDQYHTVGLAFGDDMRLVRDMRLGQYMALGGPARGPARRGIEVAGSFRRYTRSRFWGVGPETEEEAEMDFRWDRWEMSAAGGARGRHVGVKAEGGWEENQVEPGLDDGEPDLGTTFPVDTLFGATETTRFLRLGGVGVLDWTHWRGLQRRGFRAEGGPTLFLGVGGTDAHFLRWDLSATGYVPINERQQLALHGFGVVSRGRSGDGVPFTHLATLGGDRGLRSFDTERFRDRDMAALMAEWRYEIWRSIHDDVRVEGFVFGDGGTVVHDLTELDASDLRASYGFGMRAVAFPRLLFLWYLALGEEGPRFNIDLSWPY